MLKLDKTWIYAGKIYNPGDEDKLTDEAREAIEAKLKAEKGGAEEARPMPPREVGQFANMDLGPKQLASLAEAGFETEEDLGAAEDEELLAVKGINEATLGRIREALKAE